MGSKAGRRGAWQRGGELCIDLRSCEKSWGAWRRGVEPAQEVWSMAERRGAGWRGGEPCIDVGSCEEMWGAWRKVPDMTFKGQLGGGEVDGRGIRSASWLRQSWGGIIRQETKSLSTSLSLRELLIKKCSFIMEFFQKGLTPTPPPDFWNFWDTFS